MVDEITFCLALDCKKIECEHHLKGSKAPESGQIKVADLYTICRSYISDIIDELESSNDRMDF